MVGFKFSCIELGLKFGAFEVWSIFSGHNYANNTFVKFQYSIIFLILSNINAIELQI